jgi:hypothetical protein
MDERRKNRGLQAPEDVFASLGPHFTRIGKVVELSPNGLAFLHTGRGVPPKKTRVEIFNAEGDFYIGKVPVETVADKPILDERVPDSGTKRKCILKFTELTPRQKVELEDYLEKQTKQHVA